MQNLCPFCGSQMTPTYLMNDYQLFFCDRCIVTGVLNPPSEKELSEFYSGFKFQMKKNLYEKINTSEIRDWMTAIVGNGGACKMLDVGGGGGFFAKAFEDFGLGESTYLDLDDIACNFAYREMGLNRVFNEPVEEFIKRKSDGYDFIFTRHVIEHLNDPVIFIKNCTSLLNKKGTLLIQCPNGESKEGLLYSGYWNKFLSKVKSGNNWSYRKAFIFSLSKKYGWGIDPIRHLWAISGQAIANIFIDSNEYLVRVSSASLTDPVYSPYWSPKTFPEKYFRSIYKIVFSKIFRGMHLIVSIRRK